VTQSMLSASIKELETVLETTLVDPRAWRFRRPAGHRSRR
jgi:hypothetical protein